MLNTYNRKRYSRDRSICTFWSICRQVEPFEELRYRGEMGNGREMGKFMENEMGRDRNGIWSMGRDATGAKMLSHVGL